ncbi:MAG TPA: type II secretion system F family protein [Kofleriaceae bacterium]|nr:type II secretion system F family protein [Kofleriaceae bacterium]
MTDPAELVAHAVAAGGEWVAYAAIALIGCGGALVVAISATSTDSWLRRRLARYQDALDREIRFLLVRTTGARILRGQIAALAVLALIAFLIDDGFVMVLAPPILALPIILLRRRRDRRTLALEIQLDGWLMVLSNALRAAPSLGEALATSASLTRAPTSEELDLVLKEVRLGSPIDQALLHMGARVNSRVLWGAIATLLVARQTGGDVSRILEESASTLREMIRLEGVVKAKTADARAQTYVLAGMPFGLLAAIHFIDPTWLGALGRSALGYLIVGAAGALWVLGFLSARKILSVDL